MNNASYKIEERESQYYLNCYGSWNVSGIGKIERSMYNLNFPNKEVFINLTKLEALDTGGALLLHILKINLSKKASKVEFTGVSSRYKKLLTIIDKSYKTEKPIQFKKNLFLRTLAQKINSFYIYIREFLYFLGELFMKTLYLFKKPKNFRLKETVYFIQTSGLNALPIIGMTAFLVGTVIAYQTIVQLAKFGADIFVVDTSAISITRELGPMITAIVVAGRSASSFTAEIGAMKLTEEIDAMKTMGFQPLYFLVLPRIVALIIALPILIFFSDMIGILGAMVATKAQTGISFEMFIERVYEVLSLKHYVIGISKGPFFAFIIAVIGVFHGLKVSEDTESIGKETTDSVVNAIFFVIVCDALFSVIFTKLGI